MERICQNELTNHTRVTALAPTGSARALPLKLAVLSSSAAVSKAALA